MDTGPDLSFWDHIVAWFGVAALWFTGESGRVLVASGMGGLIRWIAEENRRIRDGFIAVLGGAIVGFYCWPMLLHLPMIWGGDAIEKTPEVIAMAGFVTGTMGISGIKILIALVEARALKLRDGGHE